MAPKASKKKGGNKTYVPKYAYWAKAKLAAYPDEEGCPFYLGKGQDEQTFFSGKSIRESRSKDNEEMFHRPGMSLSLSCACFEKGIDVLKPFQEANLTEDQKKNLKKTGLFDVVEFLATPEGKKFEKAIRKLNVGQHKRIPEKEARVAIDNYVDVLKALPKKVKRGLSRWASMTANSYLFSMTMSKDAALLEDLPAMADKMHGSRSQSVKAWVKSSSNVSKFKKALVVEFMDKVKKNGKEKKKRAADSSSAEDDSEDEDDKQDRKKRKRKYERKAKSSESDEDDNEDEDSEGDKNKKKAKRTADSDEDDSEDEVIEKGKSKKRKRVRKTSESQEDDSDNEDAEKDMKKKKAKKASESEEDDSEDEETEENKKKAKKPDKKKKDRQAKEKNKKKGRRADKSESDENGSEEAEQGKNKTKKKKAKVAKISESDEGDSKDASETEEDKKKKKAEEKRGKKKEITGGGSSSAEKKDSQKDKNDKEARGEQSVFEQWSLASVELFAEKLTAWTEKVDAGDIEGQDLAELLAIPCAAALKLYVPETEDLNLGQPDSERLCQELVADKDKMKAVLDHAQNLLAEGQTYWSQKAD